jgi:hypothetical protein
VRRGPTVVAGVDEPMMVHDIALTSRFLVLVLAPAFFDLPAAMSGGSHVEFPRVDDRLIDRRHSRCALATGPVRMLAADGGVTASSCVEFT